MSTIFTDDFAYRDLEFGVSGPVLGRKGRELCISAGDDHEVRMMLTEQQLIDLVEQIELAGIERGEA